MQTLTTESCNGDLNIRLKESTIRKVCAKHTSEIPRCFFIIIIIIKGNERLLLPYPTQRKPVPVSCL